MNAIHPITFDVVKVEQHERLARLERQRQVSSHSPATESPTPHFSTAILPRRLAMAGATALLMLSLIGGAVFAANAGPGAAPGGGQDRPAGGGGGGGVHLLR